MWRGIYCTAALTVSLMRPSACVARISLSGTHILVPSPESPCVCVCAGEGRLFEEPHEAVGLYAAGCSTEDTTLGVQLARVHVHVRACRRGQAVQGDSRDQQPV